MTQFNDLIEPYVIASDCKLTINDGIEHQNSNLGIFFTLQRFIIPTISIELSLKNLNETASKNIITFLLDHQGKTFKFDMSKFRADYNGSNSLFLQYLSGVINVIQVNNNEMESKPQSGAVHFNELRIQLQSSKNVIL